ncbi:MAG: hypothetical protein ACF8XB_21695 [Planctomycetota bacterium JB042]
MKLSHLGVAIVALLAATGCTWQDHATDFNGLTDHDGHKVTHMNQYMLGLNLLITQPLYHDSTLETNTALLTAEAKAEGANGVRIVQSDESTWWWVFFPFSLIITPVSSNVAADFVHGG